MNFRAWQLLDRSTQRWVMTTGRRVSLVDDDWLDGPVGRPDGIGDAWIDDHARHVGATASEVAGAGLVPDLSALDGPGFAAVDLAPPVRRFYEHTSGWRMDLWSRWTRWAEPGGRLLNALFAHRLRQLALPIDPLEVAHGMDSRVITFTDRDGAHLGTAWQRRLRSTSATVFGGYYGVATLPRARRPSVRVFFPLPNGNLVVFLRPDATGDGALVLTSPPGPFGAPGAYLVVHADDRHAWARRIPLPERFHVFVDADGVPAQRPSTAPAPCRDPPVALPTGRGAPAVGSISGIAGVAYTPRHPPPAPPQAGCRQVSPPTTSTGGPDRQRREAGSPPVLGVQAHAPVGPGAWAGVAVVDVDRDDRRSPVEGLQGR